MHEETEILAVVALVDDCTNSELLVLISRRKSLQSRHLRPFFPVQEQADDVMTAAECLKP